MSGGRFHAARFLEEQARLLATAVAATQLGRAPVWAHKHGEEAFLKRCAADIEQHICTLAGSVLAGSTVVYEHYVAWAKRLLISRGLPSTELRQRLEILFDHLHAEMRSTHFNYVERPLKKVLTKYDELPTEIESYLQPKAPHYILAHRYLALVLAGNRRDAYKLMFEALADGVPLQDLYLHVFQVCQYEVGRLWQRGELSVAQEHFCTAATQVIMSQLFLREHDASSPNRVLVACGVAGDLHEIGMRMVSDIFEMEGWDTHYLGASTPISDIVTTVKEKRADVLGISITISAHLPTLLETIQAVRADPAAASVKILVGGRPFNTDPALWQKVGADGFAGEPMQALAVAKRLVDGVPVEPQPVETPPPVEGEETCEFPDDAALEELSRLNNEFVTVRRTLTKQNRELAEANHKKNQFLGMVVHDLRNPLTVINGFANLIPMVGDVTNQQQDMLDRIERSSSYMLKSIERLLDITSIEAGHLELRRERVGLQWFIDQQITSYTIAASAKKILLVADVPEQAPEEIFVDPTYLSQAIGNLLSNAIKYSEEKTEVIIRVMPEGTQLGIAVVDQGPGIPDTDTRRLFEPFQRSKAIPTGGERSSGLGLTIADKVVRAHGGHIDIESRLGEGSTFTIYIPLQTQAAVRKQPRS